MSQRMVLNLRRRAFAKWANGVLVTNQNAKMAAARFRRSRRGSSARRSAVGDCHRRPEGAQNRRDQGPGQASGGEGLGVQALGHARRSAPRGSGRARQVPARWEMRRSVRPSRRGAGRRRRRPAPRAQTRRVQARDRRVGRVPAVGGGGARDAAQPRRPRALTRLARARVARVGRVARRRGGAEASRRAATRRPSDAPPRDGQR